MNISWHKLTACTSPCWKLSGLILILGGFFQNAYENWPVHITNLWIWISKSSSIHRINCRFISVAFQANSGIWKKETRFLFFAVKTAWIWLWKLAWAMSTRLLFILENIVKQNEIECWFVWRTCEMFSKYLSNNCYVLELSIQLRMKWSHCVNTFGQFSAQYFCIFKHITSIPARAKMINRPFLLHDLSSKTWKFLMNAYVYTLIGEKWTETISH